VIDFGTSALKQRETAGADGPGRLEGTLAYIAPEQTGRMNRRVDTRADLYSLGATLYELLSGRRPFEATDPLGVAADIRHCVRELAATATVPLFALGAHEGLHELRVPDRLYGRESPHPGGQRHICFGQVRAVPSRNALRIATGGLWDLDTTPAD
jgi:serine/threonine protein kinase